MIFNKFIKYEILKIYNFKFLPKIRNNQDFSHYFIIQI